MEKTDDLMASREERDTELERETETERDTDRETENKGMPPVTYFLSFSYELNSLILLMSLVLLPASPPQTPPGKCYHRSSLHSTNLCGRGIVSIQTIQCSKTYLPLIDPFLVAG